MDCSLRRRWERRVVLNLELLEQQWCRDLFLGFCQWNGLSRDALDIAARIDRYACFFHTLDRRLTGADQVSQAALIAVFEAEDLRRSFKVVRFLIERLELSWSQEVLREAIEAKRIGAILRPLKKRARAEIESYKMSLGNGGEHSRQLAQRTLRSYLRAAIAFREWTRWKRHRKIINGDVAAFLNSQPGYRASLGRFLSYISENGGPKLSPPPLKRRPNRTDWKNAKVVRVILDELKRSEEPRQTRALVAKLLSILYQVPLETVLRLRHGQVELEGAEMRINFGDGAVRLDSRIRHFVERLNYPLAEDRLLFEGRNGHQPLSSSAVTYHVENATRLRELRQRPGA